MLFFTSSIIAQDQKEEKWDLKEYAKIWESHSKIYVYPDGKFVVTRKVLKESKAVVGLFLDVDRDYIKDNTGELPKDLMKKLFSDVKPFNPIKAAAVPPCCPVTDKKGNILYYVYTNDCVWPCKKPLNRSGKTFYMNCCPPTMVYHNMLPYVEI